MQDMKVLEEQSIQDHIKDILRLVGEDPNRQGLRKTPARFEKAFKYFTTGYSRDIDDIIGNAVFVSDCDEMVLVKDINFFSMCEHHLLPFFGKCSVAYLPKGKIIGLSKIARVVDAFARRFQVQENLTMQIAKTLQERLKPAGVGVVIEAYHLCLMMRGAEKQNVLCVTSSMQGRFKKDPRTRSEFLQLIRHKSVT